MKRIVVMVGFVSFFLSTSCGNREVTLKSLLEEMVDRKALTYYSDIPYTIKMFSSTDPKSVSPLEKSWWANDDCSNFIREEENGGRREFVLFDTEGPGAVVRWWMTFGIGGVTEGVIRIYIDEQKDPTIEGNVLEILSGEKLASDPLATSVSCKTKYEDRGHNLYLPLPYSQHCKITYEGENLQLKNGVLRPAIYYNIEYRTYDKGMKVESINGDIIEKNKEAIASVNKILLSDFSRNSQNTLIDKKELASGESLIFHFEGQGKAVSYLSSMLESDNLPQALRSTVISMSFDGDETVWIPIGDFFGTGYQIFPSKTWFTSVSENGQMESYWLMPFQNEVDVRITNYGDNVLTIAASVGFNDYQWKESSMYFGAAWHEHYKISTAVDPELENHEWHFDVNYVDLKGRGIYMGDGITLFNTSNREKKSNWWGEGDEKIFIDGEKFPSLFGTGTEDYYGYAKCNPQPFSHPFIAQPTGAGNLEPGMTVNFRYRTLDAIPFRNEISVNNEIWHWAKTTINYAMYSFWYARPGCECNVKPDIEGVRNPVALTRSDIYELEVETK